jgi:hypothetical protein
MESKETCISVEDYGFTSTSTASDNATGLINAIATAVTANKTLVLPAGIIQVNLSPDPDGTIPITADVRIVGADRDHTTLSRPAISKKDFKNRSIGIAKRLDKISFGFACIRSLLLLRVQ